MCTQMLRKLEHQPFSNYKNITRKSMLFECALSSFHLLILVDCITRSWNITRNNINRVFSLFLGFQHSRERTVSRHDTFSRQSHRLRNKLFLGYAIDRHEPTRRTQMLRKLEHQRSNTGASSLHFCISASWTISFTVRTVTIRHKHFDIEMPRMHWSTP
jgi:hypothetical protein